jgi:hypothetical protein
MIETAARLVCLDLLSSDRDRESGTSQLEPPKAGWGGRMTKHSLKWKFDHGVALGRLGTNLTFSKANGDSRGRSLGRFSMYLASSSTVHSVVCSRGNRSCIMGAWPVLYSNSIER